MTGLNCRCGSSMSQHVTPEINRLRWPLDSLSLNGPSKAGGRRRFMNADAIAIANCLWRLRWKFWTPGTTSEYDGNTAFGAHCGGDCGGSIAVLAMAAFGSVAKEIRA